MRRATVLATAVLAMGALAAPAMAVAPEDVPAGHAEVDRIDGDTRYDTAAQTALRTYPDGADTVLVATGEKFPDALAASYLAGGVDAPIVLVKPDEIPSYTANALNELNPNTLVVLGQENAVSEATYQELSELEGVDNITRLGGDTRRETAAMIALEGGDVGTMRDLSEDSDGEYRTAIVARADEFPDALASGPLALEGRHPILLTDHGELPQATIAALTDLDIEQVVLTGGTVAISNEVQAEIENLDNIQHVERVAGDIRTETAVMLGQLTRAELGWDGTNISLARGDNFPDALTLAPLAAQMDATLFLSRNPQTIEGHTFRGIQELCEQTENLLISGGPVAISADAQGEAMLATICADYVFPISWEQETEDGKEGAEGTGWVTVEGETVCTVYDVKGLDNEADQSHIHEAPEGEDGPVVMDLGAPNFEGFLATCQDDAELATDLQLRPWDFYVNIHTPEYPLGAARGQIAEEPQVPAAGEYNNEFSVLGDAVLGDTGEDDLVAGATLYTNDAGELCLTVEGLDATDATTATLYEGAADQDAQGDALATFADPGTTESCTDEVDPRFWLMDGTVVHLSVTDSTDAEIARGQVEPTHDAELTAEGAAAVQGAAFLYEAAADGEVCAAVALDNAESFNGDITVTDDADTVIVTFTNPAGEEPVFFGCAAVTSDGDPALITVPTTGDTLTGDLTEEPPAA